MPLSFTCKAYLANAVLLKRCFYQSPDTICLKARNLAKDF
ncbi:hypothetical protein T05_12262 [Trichinella murrelli]|uniref:Uncharacterized protein n=1 Tax=Trichinella murrelli TaxID=144512 RepID=A0A0V0SSX3_9BILA|nr:hypothetical protein T05_12262 [Trichinella murrelli]